MGLWGSKEPRSVTIKSPDDVAEVQLSEEALTNLVKIINTEKKSKKDGASSAKNAASPSSSADNNNNNNNTLRLLPDLHDKRIETYERNLVQNFDKASKEVDAMFRERYKTIPVCFDVQKTVQACYQENPSLPLKCNDIVSQYLRCVEQERKRLSSA